MSLKYLIFNFGDFGNSGTFGNFSVPPSGVPDKPGFGLVGWVSPW